ncbi:flippase [Aerococcaceae bacterium NML160702]|nr:flippase [Aerococcaceae bacterium NML160702]
MSQVANQKSVKFNFVMNFILTLSSIVFPLVTTPYISRVILAEGTGRVEFVTSIVGIFAMFGMMGIPTYGIRACARVRGDQEALSQTVYEILIINTIAMVLTLVVYIVSIMTVPKFVEEQPLFIINIIVLVFNVLGVEWLYRALEQYQYITVRSIIFKFIALVMMFLFVKQTSDYMIYGAITIVANVGSNLLNFLNMRKFVELKAFKPIDLKQHLRPIMSFFMMAIAITIYTSLDKGMLGMMSNAAEVGYYAAAIKVKMVLVTLVTSLGAVLLPRLSYYVEQGEQKAFQEITIKAFRFVLIVALPLTIYFTLFAKESILLLASAEFVPAIVPMKIIMPTLLFIGVSNLLGIQILVPLKREDEVLYSVAFGAVINLLINFWLIPSLAATGAAIGTTVAEFAVVAFQAYVLRDFLKLVIGQIAYWKMGVALMWAIATALVASHWLEQSPFIVLVVTSVLFFGVYGVVLIALKETFVTEMLKKVLKRGT